MKNITKDDYKRFKECAKQFLILQNDQNYNLTIQMIDTEKVSLHFNLIEKSSSSKIDEDDFFEKQKKSQVSYENIIRYDDDIFSDDNDHQQSKEEMDSYPGEQITDGLIIGEAAKEYFKQKNEYECYDFTKYSKKMALKKTSEMLLNSKYNVFFEPAFLYKNYITRCDILIKDEKNNFTIIEVKASTCFEKVKTTNSSSSFEEKLDENEFKLKSLKKYHHDLEYQYFVLTKNKLNVTYLNLMLIRSDYVKEGDIDFTEFFNIISGYYHRKKLINFLESSKCNIEQIESDLSKMESIMDSVNSDNKFLKFLIQSDCANQYTKINCKHVTSFLNEYNVFELYNGRERKTDLFFDYKIEYIKDLDPDFSYEKIGSNDKPRIVTFNDKQKRQIRVTKSEEGIIEESKLDTVLKIRDNFKYPIYMYDFETFKSSIPIYDYSNSYQQIPFQYSVHILKNKYYDYQTLKSINHHYYIGDGEEDCRIKLAEKLVKDLTSEGEGTYVAYSSSFEKSVILKLYIFFENLMENNLYDIEKGKYIQSKLKYIWNNTIDLLDFFNQFYIYKKEFHGSVSIKKTLPAFVPEFTYDKLKIRKGDMASETYRRLVEKNISQKIWKENFEQPMIDYCNRDTLAMVVLFKKVEELIDQELIKRESKQKGKENNN